MRPVPAAPLLLTFACPALAKDFAENPAEADANLRVITERCPA